MVIRAMLIWENSSTTVFCHADRSVQFVGLSGKNSDLRCCRSTIGRLAEQPRPERERLVGSDDIAFRIFCRNELRFFACKKNRNLAGIL